MTTKKSTTKPVKNSTPTPPPAKPTLTNYNPTLQTWDAKIGKKTYTLCFDLRFLAMAESELHSMGNDVNLFQALPGKTVANILTVFACSIRRFHPEIGFDDACALLRNPAHIYAVDDAINKLWENSIPVADADEAKLNPTRPGD